MLLSMTRDAATIRRIAEDTHTDRRSVRAEAEGRHVRGRAGERIRVALRLLGIAIPISPPEQQKAA